MGQMKTQEYATKNIEIIQEMYRNTKAYIYTDIENSKFKIKKGVKQADLISGILFNTALKEVFKTMGWEKKGI